jgi:hypothetical protein
MRYYLGVDWADQTHAVWVGDEGGTKITARTVPHTAEGLSEWGRELDEWPPACSFGGSGAPRPETGATRDRAKGAGRGARLSRWDRIL